MQRSRTNRLAELQHQLTLERRQVLETKKQLNRTQAELASTIQFSDFVAIEKTSIHPNMTARTPG